MFLQAYWYPDSEIATMLEKATTLYTGTHVSISLQHTTVTIKTQFIFSMQVAREGLTVFSKQISPSNDKTNVLPLVAQITLATVVMK